MMAYYTIEYRLNTMNIRMENHEQYSVQAYSDTAIQIDSVTHKQSLIVSRHELFTDWTIRTIDELDEASLAPLLRLNPEVILFGHNKTGAFPPSSVMGTLLNRHIGVECMNIGAACRTFNVLLHEQREVVLGVIF